MGPDPPDQPERWERHDWWGVVLEAPDVAVLARFSVQPQENVRVLLAPAGHPFCLYTGCHPAAGASRPRNGGGAVAAPR